MQSPITRFGPTIGATTTRLLRGQSIQAKDRLVATGIRVVSGLLAIEISLDADRRQVLAFAGPGDSFIFAAEMALPRLRARALSTTNLSEVEHDWRRADADGSHQPNILMIADVWLNAAMLGRLTAEERVASFMLRLAYRERRRDDANCRFYLAMNRQDVADCLGLNPDTLGRILSRLQSEHVIELHGRSDVTILDLAKLEAISPIAAALRWRVGAQVVQRAAC